MRNTCTAFLAFVAAALFCAAPAGAADLGRDGSMKDEYAAPAASAPWTGFYIGLHVGAASGVFDHETAYVETYAGGAYSNQGNTDLGAQGLLGGIRLGGDYRFAQSRFFLGAFVDADWTGLSGESSDRSTGGGAGSAEWGLDASWTFSVRAGVIVTHDTAAYVLAGCSQADGYADLTGGHFSDGSTSKSFTADGWTFGGGVETNLGKGFFARAEYAFTDYSRETIDRAAGAGDGWSWSQTESVKPQVHAVKLGVSYKIGAGN